MKLEKIELWFTNLFRTETKVIREEFDDFTFYGVKERWLLNWNDITDLNEIQCIYDQIRAMEMGLY